MTARRITAALALWAALTAFAYWWLGRGDLDAGTEEA